MSDAGDEEEEEKILRNAWAPFSAYFFEWLKTPQGKETAEKVSGLLDSLQKRTLDSQHRQTVIDTAARYLLVGGVLGAAATLRWYDKLDAPIIGLFSGVVGYLLGRQRSK